MGILDILGIVAVFAIVLYIGWSATKKTQSADDFLMANRSLGKIRQASVWQPRIWEETLWWALWRTLMQWE